jgi:hypothetical protein
MNQFFKLLFLAMATVVLGILLESTAVNAGNIITFPQTLLLFAVMLTLLFIAIYPFGKSH